MKNMNAETPYIRAPVCEAKGRMNLCTKCTQPQVYASQADLYVAQPQV